MLNNASKASIRNSLREYNDLIETIAKIEFKKLSSGYLIDFSELINIGTQVIHHLCTSSNIENYNKSYISTAIKWAIRNEVRRRYKWYSLKTKKAPVPTEENKGEIRDAVYKAILSIDEMADAENPTQIKDESMSPEDSIVFNELSTGLKEAIKKLPRENANLLRQNSSKTKN